MVFRRIGQFLDRYIDYHPTERWNICGIQVYFKPTGDGASGEEWKELLEQWMPIYRHAGWLTGLEAIRIRDGVAGFDSVGAYEVLRPEIHLEKEYLHAGHQILTHEMIHHAHITLEGWDIPAEVPPSDRRRVRWHVSGDARVDLHESIAEIGTRIVYGDTLPDYVHRYYERHGGPPEVYDVRNKRPKM